MNQITPKKTKPDFIKTAILIFIFIIIVVPFFESKRIILWTSQNESQNYNLFSDVALRYAVLSEQVKKETGLAYFFNSEYDFLAQIKESPVIFQPDYASVKKNVQPPRQDISPNPKPISVIAKTVEVSPENNPSTSSSAVKDTLTQAEKDKLYNLNYLIMGDSFMSVNGGLGSVIEGKLLDNGDKTVNRHGVVSSGLSRPDYFNWTLETGKLASEYKPDVAIVFFGANDNQNLTNEAGDLAGKYGSQEWNDAYSKRVDDILDVFKNNNVSVFWVGLPIMREKWFSANVAKLDAIYENECNKYQNAHFISTWNVLADANGNYADYLKNANGINMALRLEDGIHLTLFGGELVTNEIFKQMGEMLK